MTDPKDSYIQRLNASLLMYRDQIVMLTAERDALLQQRNDLQHIKDRCEVERDAYAKAADSMAASHKVERDELSRLYENTLRREYALYKAAELALDALHAVLHDCDDIDMVESNEPGRDVGPWQLSNEAIAALKAVL